MDPETVRQLADSMNQLNNSLSALSPVLSGLTKSANDSSTIYQQGSAAQQKNTGVSNTSSSGLNKLQEAQKTTAETMSKASAGAAKAMDQAGSALGSFSKALVSNEEGFAKYGVAVSGLGKAALSLTVALGPVGIAFGALALAIGAVTAASLKQTDSLLKGVDSLSDIGAAGSITSDEMYNMTHKMNLSVGNLEIFTKAANSARTSMVALGGTAGEGIKEFGSLTAVTKKQLNAYQRLGISQEELMQNQADYLDIQLKSGFSISKEDIANGKVQEQMLKYSNDLLVLEKVTGANSKEAKDMMAQANAANNIAIHNADLDAKIKAAKEGSDEQLALKRQKVAEQQILKGAAATGDPAQLAAVQAHIATGSYGGAAKLLLQTGQVNYDAMIEKAKVTKDFENQGDVGELTGQARNEAAAGTQRTLNNSGRSMAAMLNENTANATGASTKAIAHLTKTLSDGGHDYAKEIASGKSKIGKPEEGTTNPETDADKAQKSRNDLTNTEITAKQTYDDLVRRMNPLIGHTGALTALAVAAGAVAALMVAGMAKQALGGIGSLFGGKTPAGEKAAGGMLGGLTSTFGGKAEKSALGAVEKGALGAVAGKGAGGSESAAMDGLSKAASALGPAVGGILTGIVNALAAAGKVAPQIALGGGAIGVAIAAIGAGLAAATAIIGVALPSLAKGLVAFDKVNGPNLQAVGFGMAGLGAGILAMGAGQIVGAIGNIANFFFGGGDPIEKVSTQVVAMQKYNFDPKRVKDNADALVNFSRAMSSYKGMGSGLGVITSVLGDALSNFYKVDPPVDKFAKFSNLPVDKDKAQINSAAFVNFANAMATYRGGPGLGSAISSLAGAGLNKIFGQDGPIESFSKFAKMDFGPKANQNADAFYKYAQAASMMSKSSSAAEGSAPPAGGGGDGGGGGGGGGGSSASSGGGAMGAMGSAMGSIGGALGAAGSAAGGAFKGAMGAGEGIAKSVGGALSGALSMLEGEFTGVDPKVVDMTKRLGRPLYATSGKRSLGWVSPRGAVSSPSNPHVLGKAIDIAVRPHGKIPGLDDKAQQEVTRNAIAMGFTGIGAEGDHLHFDTSHAGLMSWGADYKNSSTPGWLRQMIPSGGAGAQKSKTMKASAGGAFSGPGASLLSDSGGKKLSPIHADSILSKLAKTNAEVINQHKEMFSSSTTETSGSDQGAMNIELYNMIQDKLGHVLSALEHSHSTQNKMLKHAMV
jgi:hypothetical protein